MHSTADGTLSLFTTNGQRKYLTGDERRHFLAAAATSGRPELATLCATLAYTGCRLSAKDLFHCLALGEFVYEFIEIADLSHHWFLNLLHADAANDAGNQRT